MNVLVRSTIAAALALLIAASTLGAPAYADTAGQKSTRTLILTGLAAAAAIILYNNYHHKQVAANSVVGYTRDGGVVHGDGRITYPDGTVLYTGTGSRQRCSYTGYGVPCGQRAYAYHGRYANQNPYYGRPNMRNNRGERDDRERERERERQNNGNHNGNGNGNDNNNDGGGDGGGGRGN
jgi:hypothetical protein